MIAGELRQPSESELVVLRRGLAVVRLEQADDVFVEVEPPAGGGLVAFDIGSEALFIFLRHGQISGQKVKERGDVGRSLNRCVPAKGEDPAARPPDVAEEQLQDRGGADDLHACGMLRPADGVADRRSFLAAGGAREHVGDFEEVLSPDAAEPLHHLRRVARKVAFQHLENAARMLQGLIAVARIVLPGGGVIFPAVPPGEKTAEVFGVFEIGAKDRRRVRVADDVLAEVALVLNRVVDQRAEKDDVAAGAKRHPVVGHRRRAREARIDVNDLRAVFLARFDDPLKADRMVLGHR